MNLSNRRHTRTTEEDLLEEDPEVERTFRQSLRARRVQSTSRANEMAGEQQQQQMAEQQQQRIKLKDRAQPNVCGFRSSISEPAITTDNFELKPGLIQMIQHMQFGGGITENPNVHIARFLQLCNTLKMNGVSDEAIRLCLFPFSLRDRASEWLMSMPPDTFTTWEGLSAAFLAKFFPPARTAKIRNELNNFSQKDGESLYEAWERLKDLQRQCPHHGIPDWLVIQNFYQGLEPAVRGLIDSAAGGSLMSKTEEEAFELIEEMALHNFQYGNSRGNVRKGSIYELETLNLLSAQVEQLSKKLDKMGTSVVASSSAMNCEIYGKGHNSSQCIYSLQQTEGEQLNVVGIEAFNQKPVGNPFSNCLFHNRNFNSVRDRKCTGRDCSIQNIDPTGIFSVI